ncbi:MAG: cation transporter [Leptolyngbyaceae cyanobacterium SL_7_1]|nr:cation transporter [Leptolyngbyaceae cyanobacterium SL_7_1]
MFHPHSCLDCQPASPADPAAQTKVRYLWIALILISSFAIAEFWVSSSSHSLALSADAGHLLSDGLALGIALLATKLAQLPASARATFGYRRIEIVAALINGVGLGAIALWIGIESFGRLFAPPEEILSLPMVITAAIGLGINTLCAFLLHDHSHDDLNLRGAFLHLLADATSSVGVILAAGCVWLLDWNWADAAVSLLVAGLILLSAIPLIRQSLTILLEHPPTHVNVDELQGFLQGFDGVVRVDQLRVWTIALGQTALAAHLQVSSTDGAMRDRLLADIQTALRQTVGIQEIWLQITTPTSAPLVNLSLPQRLDWAIAATSDSQSQNL